MNTSNVGDQMKTFFDLMNRRNKNGNKFEFLPDDEGELFNPTTTEESYKLFEPSSNYFLGVYLSIVGKKLNKKSI